MVENKESEKKMAQLQMLEQNIQNFLLQKQNFQTQLMEIDNALSEVEKTKGVAYKIFGTVMVEASKDDIKKDLEGKKEILILRIKTIEKQENQLKEKASKLQEEVLAQIKGK